MELRQLRYFVAVAEELHFRRAAERCYVAQPAVSEQVRKLEQELGARLLERTPRAVTLTEAGEAMLDEARRILTQADAARTAARAACGRATRLRIGYAPAALVPGVAHALRCVAGSADHVHTTLEPGAPARLVGGVADERLDAAVVPLPAPADGLRVTPLAGQRVLAALRAGHPHAVRESIDLGRLCPDQLLVLPREANRPLYDAVLALCRDAAVSPALLELPAGEFEHALLAVAAGRDIALLPESLAERYAAPGVRFLPVAGALPTVAAGVVSRRDRQHAPTVAFLRALAMAAPPERAIVDAGAVALAA